MADEPGKNNDEPKEEPTPSGVTNEKYKALEMKYADSQDYTAQLEAKVKDLETKVADTSTVEELAKLKTELETTKTSNEELKNQILSSKKESLINTYKLSEEILKDATEDQLAFAENILKGKEGDSGDVPTLEQGGGSGGGQHIPTGGRNKILAYLDSQK